MFGGPDVSEVAVTNLQRLEVPVQKRDSWIYHSSQCMQYLCNAEYSHVILYYICYQVKTVLWPLRIDRIYS